jgi:hypothetical protein
MVLNVDNVIITRTTTKMLDVLYDNYLADVGLLTYAANDAARRQQRL